MNLIEPQPPATRRRRRRAGAVPTAGAIWLIGIPPCPRVAPSAVRHATWRESDVDTVGARLGATTPWESAMYKTRDARWPPCPEGELSATAHSQENGRRDQRGLTAAPGDPSAGQGVGASVPLTALGEGSAGRSIDEKAASPRVRPGRPSAFAAHGSAGAAEIRRCVPTPSPFHSPPPPLRRPGKLEGQSSLQNSASRKPRVAVINPAWTHHPFPSILAGPVFHARGEKVESKPRRRPGIDTDHYRLSRYLFSRDTGKAGGIFVGALLSCRTGRGDRDVV
jgi:hypothetical protein